MGKVYPQPSGMSTHRLLKVFLVLVALVIAVALLTGGYESLGSLSRSGNEEQLEPLPEGLLVLSVAAKSPDASTAWIFPAKYDFGKSTFDYVPADKLAASPEGFNLAYQHIFSGNGQYIVFVGATDIENVSSFSEIPMQIYRADVSNTQTEEEFTERLLNAEIITEGTGVVKQNPSVSDLGEVLYVSRTSGDPRSLFSSEAEQWSIHYVSQDGREEELAKGISPKWVGDNQFVFLKNDGLYLYSLATGEERNIWGMQGTATMGMSLDVSDDYQYVAWTAPGAGAVYIFRAFNWGIGILTLSGTISAPAVSSTFSPDNRFLAVEAIVPGEVQGELQVLIGYYNIETFREVASPFVLATVDTNQTRLSDWRP